MFDLFRSRAKAVRIMLGAIMGVMALSMLVYLIPGTGITAADSGDQVVAEIGKTDVTVTDIQQQLKTALQSQRLPPDLAATYIPQLIDKSIADRAIVYEAQRMGFKISDADLAYTLRSFPFASLPPDQYQNYIEQNQGITVPEFENNVLMQSYEDSLLTVAVEGVLVTPAEAEAAYRKQNEKIKLDYIAFNPATLAADIKPTQDEINAYYAKNKNFYNLPETRSVQMVIADQAKVADTIQISDAQVQAYYDSHKDQYQTPERVHARHILLSTSNKPKDEVAKIKAQAEDLLKQIKGGGNFADLAKKYSQDPGSAQKGGDLGWVSRGQMVKNFEDTVFTLKPNEISGVVTTEYGFHIIQVLEKQPPHLQSLDEVKSQIVGNLRNQTVFDKMQELADQAHTMLVKAPQSAQAVATQLNLTFLNVPRHPAGSPLPELGNDSQVPGAIDGMKPGEVSQVMQSGNKLLVAVVTAVNPPHPAELSEVEAAVRTNYAQTRAVEQAKENAAEAVAILKKSGDIKAAAKAAGGEVKSTDFFAENGAAEGIGSASLFGDLFSKPVGTVFGPLTNNSQTYVGTITGRQDADMAKFAQQREQIVLQLKSKKAQERQSLLQDSVLSELIKQGKVKKHQQVIDRLIAQYRS